MGGRGCKIDRSVGVECRNPNTEPEYEATTPKLQPRTYHLEPDRNRNQTPEPESKTGTATKNRNGKSLTAKF